MVTTEAIKQYLWQRDQQRFTLAYESFGQGSPVLLLPAFSTVSSRSEVREMAGLLATQHQTITLDWLGFGQSARPPVDYRPALFHQLLQDFATDVFAEPVAIIAAGHAAGYALRLAQQKPQLCSQLVLIAPTWRGPLPTMGASRAVADAVRGLVRSPILGQALYQLNTTPAFLSWMYRRHVYTDPAKLTSEFIEQKHRITQQPGARYAPAAFVTGGLDPAESRDDFLAWFQGLSIPVMVIIGEQAPPRSKAEMEAIASLEAASLKGVQIERLPGTLGMHEEYAAETAAVILPFLSR
jgi:pimeloyl-ACP methyl ester carboxylesterase